MPLGKLCGCRFILRIIYRTWYIQVIRQIAEIEDALLKIKLKTDGIYMNGQTLNNEG